ncbi:MAG: secondary thiamine-phosphate synthase enzyme YjbQ [bacterium]|nr:secondary thiamine-phosphate synthase enzyme YjbQ [bacterium]
MRTLTVASRRRAEMIDITAAVARAVREIGVADGACCVSVPHTTAGVTVNENADPSVREDILACLGRLAPAGAAWAHAEGNADSHIKASLVGSSASVPVAGGALVLGAWQGIFLCEFDGPRSRMVHVAVLPA